MTRRPSSYRHEWGRGPERLKNAQEKLAPLWEIRRLLWEENKTMFPFSEDYNALHSTVDHIERLAKHFGVELEQLGHIWKPTPAGKIGH